MMSEIKLLDENTINKIAAGEVVERPFSVVKELVENAIDAGSSKIAVDIKDGGRTYIKVSDNGIGIAKNQAEKAFFRHATSKISSIDDMESIATMGFRGEALASIASVSQLEMNTKTEEDELGTKIEISGGTISAIKETSTTTGTSVTVRNLFYNTPVRKKFLKSSAAESGFISEYISKAALSHPNISFKLTNNNSLILQTNGKNDFLVTVHSVYGKKVAENLLPLDYDNDGIKLSGYIGKPELARANRIYEDFFVNKRYVKDKIVSKAAEEAYKTYIMQGRFPIYIINLDLEQSLVDVNAHPQKLEVRFQNEDKIYAAVYSAVTNALRTFSLIPKDDFSNTISKIVPKPENDNNSVIEKNKEIPQNNFYTYRQSVDKSALYLRQVVDMVDLQTTIEPKNDQDLNQVQVQDLDHVTEQIVVDEPINQVFQVELENIDANEESGSIFSSYKIIGQLFSLYWIVQSGESMYLIDQHAAHERVLYEKILDNIKNQSNYSQILINPVNVDLTIQEQLLLSNNISYFEEIGFDLIILTQRCLIKAVPMIFDKPNNIDFFVDIMDMLMEDSGLITSDAKDSLFSENLKKIATIACKSAVKANHSLSVIECEALIKQMLKLENPFTCPHGRPTIIEMTKGDIEKKFKRVL